MTAWTPPTLDEDAANALLAIESPSRPRPLDGSRRLTPDLYWIDRSQEQVIAAYQAPDAPVPAGSVVTVENGVVVIRAPFSATAVVFTRSAQGCRYSLVAGPTLRISGGHGAAPDGEFFTMVGIATVNPMDGTPQLSMFATPRVGDQPWIIWVTQASDDSGQPTTTALCVKGTWADLQQVTANTPKTGTVPATITATPAGVKATFKAGRSTVTVDARRTHSFVEALAEAGAFETPKKPDASLQITCVTKTKSKTLDQRIGGVGGHGAGKPWRMTAAELVSKLEAGDRYWMADDDTVIDIVVATGTTGVKYPHSAGGGTNKLLQLPKCRAVGQRI